MAHSYLPYNTPTMAMTTTTTTNAAIPAPIPIYSVVPVMHVYNHITSAMMYTGANYLYINTYTYEHRAGLVFNTCYIS